jgi:hypothetical protein
MRVFRKRCDANANAQPLQAQQIAAVSTSSQLSFQTATALAHPNDRRFARTRPWTARKYCRFHKATVFAL